MNSIEGRGRGSSGSKRSLRKRSWLTYGTNSTAAPLHFLFAFNFSLKSRVLLQFDSFCLQIFFFRKYIFINLQSSSFSSTQAKTLFSFRCFFLIISSCQLLLTFSTFYYFIFFHHFSNLKWQKGINKSISSREGLYFHLLVHSSYLKCAGFKFLSQLQCSKMSIKFLLLWKEIVWIEWKCINVKVFR